ncbi:Alveolar macrophage chemotactic factor 2 [Myotis davidii]|uniref:C-X-C motif chemokine n=1 Tax=Myotis davidii TaxID=225400 RepID=L5LF45_MYODS|nr:Alveolar macrophage chemotactic factor 2 [Myotis davidii]
MSLLPRRAASRPGPWGSLCALLALLQLLTLPGPLASAPAGPSGIIVSELRCVCLTPTHRIRPQMIHHLEMVPAGPGCPNVEIIATMKKGNKICLDPEAHVVKKIIQKLLNRGPVHKIRALGGGVDPHQSPIAGSAPCPGLTPLTSGRGSSFPPITGSAPSPGLTPRPLHLLALPLAQA